MLQQLFHVVISVFIQVLFHMLHTNIAIICSKYFNSINLMFQQLFLTIASVLFELFMLFGLGGARWADGARGSPGA
jgi:hypothetical protein